MGKEAHKIWPLEKLKGRTLEEQLREVASSREPITIILDEEDSVTIEPTLQLKPLPQLEGRVPEDWKDAVY